MEETIKYWSSSHEIDDDDDEWAEFYFGNSDII